MLVNRRIETEPEPENYTQQHTENAKNLHIIVIYVNFKDIIFFYWMNEGRKSRDRKNLITNQSILPTKQSQSLRILSDHKH